MAILSNNLLLSDAQSVTASTLSTNTIDFGQSGTPAGAAAPIDSDMGRGTTIPILIQCVEDAAASGSATVTFSIETSDNENMTASTVVYASAAISKDDLVAGFRTSVEVLPNKVTGRYLAVRYSVASGPLTAGKFTAGFTAGNANGW